MRCAAPCEGTYEGSRTNRRHSTTGRRRPSPGGGRSRFGKLGNVGRGGLPPRARARGEGAGSACSCCPRGAHVDRRQGREAAGWEGTLAIHGGSAVPFSSDAREHRFAGVADLELPKQIRRLNESQLRGLVFELALEHALLQTWTGYPIDFKRNQIT